MTRKKEKVNVWEIRGDEGLNEQAEIIAEIRKNVKELENDIIELEEKLKVTNARINIYVKNVLKLETYDNNKDLIFINEKYEASIYPIENHADFFDEDGKLTNLPKPDKIYKLSKAQSVKILDMIGEYNHLALDYTDLIDMYEENINYHEELWKDIHETLNQTTMFQLHNNIDDEYIENFDEDKHLLLITQNEQKVWNFNYIRKEDKERFFKEIGKKTRKK